MHFSPSESGKHSTAGPLIGGVLLIHERIDKRDELAGTAAAATAVAVVVVVAAAEEAEEEGMK